MKVIADIETDSLNPKVIWVAVIKEVESGRVHIFERPDLNPGPLVELAQSITMWIGHNFLSFDGPVLNRLVLRDLVLLDRVCDTLVVSRLTDFKRGGHSLEDWGERLKFPKVEFNDFSQLTKEMIDYCVNDVELNYLVFKRLEKVIYHPLWKQSLRVEHETEMMCKELHDNGFAFDIERAEALAATLALELVDLESGFQIDFPSRYRAKKEVWPALTKKGKIHNKDFRWLDGKPEDHGYQADAPFTIIEPISFDPASKTQCIDRLWEAGWKPVNKTKGYKDLLKTWGPKDESKLEHFKVYGWKIDDINLATLPVGAPASAKRLTRWLHLTGRKNQLQGWIDAYNYQTKRIHGKFFHIGSWSHRMSHSAPNMANASKEREYRSLWIADEGKVLVGCDAASIQLRVLAHYFEDEEFTKAISTGREEDGTDAHTLNVGKLGDVCTRWGEQSRKRAKTFIYAFVLGASPGKVAEIFECKVHEAEAAIGGFIEAYPGLARLKREIIPRDANRGYFIGFDGRAVKCDSEHLMLAGYLQNGEACIMKLARMLWSTELREKGIWFKHVNFVHDEFQTVTNLEEAHNVGNIQASAIVRAGEILNVRCPQAGEYKIGFNWAETH
jgi:DNA polymerase-1